MRLYFFVFIGGGGFLFPFLSLFYERQGLSGTQIGILGTCVAVISLVAAPLWSRWSDNIDQPWRLLQVALLGSTACYLLLSQQTLFFYMILLVSLEAVLASGVEPISTTMALGTAKESGDTGFGSIRLWGSLGWAIIVLIAGGFIERKGLFSAFAGYAALMIASVLILQRLFVSSSGSMATPPPRKRVAPRELLEQLARDPAMVGLAIALAITWLTRVGLYQFEPIYMDQLGASESLIGLASMIGALVELPAMLLADHWVIRYGSHRVLGWMWILYALLAVVILIAPTIPVIVSMRVIDGFAYSFYTVALLVFLSERAPFGQVATSLALYTFTLRGLISIVGSPLAGFIFDAFGAYFLYAFLLLGSLLGLVVFRLMVTGKRSKVRI
jgi:PPP family 3-phenylpropionic acid transporter